MTDNIKLPPLPPAQYFQWGKPAMPVYQAHEMQAYAREAVRLNAQAVQAAPQPAQAEQTDARDAARWRYIAWHIGVAWNEQGFTSLVRIVSDKHREMLGDMVDRMMAGDWPGAAPKPAQPLDLSVMELAESVGLIGPASRTDDLHEAIQRFHDLIVVSASIKAARHFADGLAQPAQQTCNCRWVDDIQVQQCTLHQAHVEAIHEWAERAKTAEAKLNAQQPLTDEQCDAIYTALDTWARKADAYEFGLPRAYGDGAKGGREIIRNAISGVKND